MGQGDFRPFEDARPLTDNTDRPVAGYFWSRDGKYLLYVKDQGAMKITTFMPSIHRRPMQKVAPYPKPES
jgi:hypothetical protein